ncbi:MAG: MurR/RpiR family transcriptional regulator [Beduini sp.]|uniref:MurR/RpiR family transcriptional regulator n=1 Tax=Beduini sp. TaxID=1922300 RepID=UPI0039A3BB30
MRIAFYQLVLFINTATQHDVYYDAAKVILKNIRQIPHCSITDVAEMCYVSPATISRLCRKLNFESFIDFKTTVCLSIEQFNNVYENIYFPNSKSLTTTLDNDKEILKAHHDSVIHTIDRVYETIDARQINQLVDLIHDSSRIIFLGYYYSQNTTMQLQIELAYLGKECFGLFDEKGQLEILQEATENDLVILSSMTGKFIQQSSEVIRLFKNTKAHKVIITQNVEETLKDQYDLFINLGGPKDSLISKFSLTYLFEIIEMFYHIKYTQIH